MKGFIEITERYYDSDQDKWYPYKGTAFHSVSFISSFGENYIIVCGNTILTCSSKEEIKQLIKEATSI